MKKSPKYYLSECLIIRDENQYLVEHLTKGIQAGIEHFFIYDNMSKESVSDYLSDTELSNYCTVERFRSTDTTQLDSYKKFLKDHRDETKWCAFVDTDEIWEGDLKKFCKEHENYVCIRFQQIMHGSNGQSYADYSKWLSERFRDHIVTDFFYFKCVVQVEYLLAQLAHFSYVYSKDIPEENWMIEVPNLEKQCQLHHYIYKSFEEWCIKIKRGSAYSGRIHKLDMFFRENSIPEKDKVDILSKYNLKLSDFEIKAERR